MVNGENTATPPAAAARALVRRLDRAALGTALADDSWPYASLVLTGCAPDASPLLLISKLAEHTRNLARDARAALLFDGTQGLDDPLTGARATLLGRIEPSDDAALRARFLARHPDAAQYAGFADFGLYRMQVARAHLVAGFGAIHWIEAAEWMADLPDPAALAAAEGGILSHMNADHAEAVAAFAEQLLGQPAGPWEMTGIDPDGADLRCGAATARLAFDRPVTDPEGARVMLAALARKARSDAARGTG